VLDAFIMMIRCKLKKGKMKHEKWLNNYENNFEKLAVEIGSLRYDSLEKFLSLLSKKIEEDSEKDNERDRKKLSKSLKICSDNLNEASKSIKEAWRISKPFMPPNDLENKEKM
jgi:predicted transcriptional regulator